MPAESLYNLYRERLLAIHGKEKVTAMKKIKELTVKNLTTLFGVTAMTIYSWKKGVATKSKMPDEWTPAAITRWAKRNGLAMLCEPATLLGTGIGKPGPKPRVGDQKVATIDPSRAGSFGKAAALRNSRRKPTVAEMRRASYATVAPTGEAEK